MPGGVIRGNTLVKRSIAFAPLTTTRVRVLVEGTLDGWSRLTEVEAFESGGGTPGNTVPTISLTSPAEGASAAAPATFTLAATATDAEGPVASVAFYQNGAFIAQDASSPFSVPWTNVAAGSYTLTAIATDAGGLTATSAAVHVSATTPGGGGARLNVAAASQGGTVTSSSTASSTYPAGAVINGDRRGASYYGGDVWHDATGATFPDWVEIAFAGSKTIDEIAVYGVQDAWDAPSEPSPTLTWRYWGVADFTVQTWTGSAWQTVSGGVIRGNRLVKRAVTFPPITTARIRVLVEGSVDGWSRLTEVEAFQGGGGTPGNSAPAVSLTSPTEGASAVAPASFTVAATASDAEGPVASVAFFANDVSIGQDTASPFSLPWANVAAGSLHRDRHRHRRRRPVHHLRTGARHRDRAGWRRRPPQRGGRGPRWRRPGVVDRFSDAIRRAQSSTAIAAAPATTAATCGTTPPAPASPIGSRSPLPAARSSTRWPSTASRMRGTRRANHRRR